MVKRKNLGKVSKTAHRGRTGTPPSRLSHFRGMACLNTVYGIVYGKG